MSQVVISSIITLFVVIGLDFLGAWLFLFNSFFGIVGAVIVWAIMVVLLVGLYKTINNAWNRSNKF